ncbi:MAG: M20/M25/M40 family metallo-hydrolase [Nitrospirae bacterium]|nr:M20/M25/M40 family metallo-hydrolase [Nitrospirota bacterium]
MRRLFVILLTAACLLMIATDSSADEGRIARDAFIRHDLKIVLYPQEQRFTAEDTMTLPDKYLPEFQFTLHGGLKPVAKTDGVIIIPEGSLVQGGVSVEAFRVNLPQGMRSVAISFGGVINHPIETQGRELAKGISSTPGVISSEGIFLSGNSYWYPRTDEQIITFSLEVSLPPRWDAVSQGSRTLHEKAGDGTTVRWESAEPQDEIFLIAGRFHEYTQSSGRVSSMVFLLSPDDELAGKYLDATNRYIAMYEGLIGRYPYRKFALVENFWETGFGMPSFTLLGTKVIRLPFIINSSYPHEILHSWWGNSVFTDYTSGNWSEGLTAYLADHLIKEQQGNGSEYRMTTLQKYADYVRSGRDFPLTAFRSRHSSSTEAIGYGKSLMFFHMLRLALGDRVFKEGLQEFFRENRFRFASFQDLEKGFEKASGKDLKNEFGQWVKRTGSPKLRLRDAVAMQDGEGHVLTAVIEQMQDEEAYGLRIPVAVTMEGDAKAYQVTVTMDKKSLDLNLRLPRRPVRVDLDPEFDIFRRLDRDEIPPALSQAFGANKMLILLPSSSDKKILSAYHELAGALSRSGPEEVEIRLDREVESLPADRAVTVLGWENRFFRAVSATLSAFDVSFNKEVVRIGRNKIQRADHSFVFTSVNPSNRDYALTLILSDNAGSLPGLGRKLPHYHKYSYLGFSGNEPENMAKGRWPVLDSPLTAYPAGRDGRMTRVGMSGLAEREPLTLLPQVFSGQRMLGTIGFLSGDELKGRGFGTEGLDRAAQYIAERFMEAGLEPAGDDKSYFQVWEERDGDPEKKVMLKNVVGVITGTDPEKFGQSVVVGAHYDHLGLGWPDVKEGNRGKIHSGADDNASGVSVLLELAKVLGKTLRPERSVVFVAFTAEEAGKRGSKYYIENMKRYPSEMGMGMLNLDTVGRLGRKKLLILGAGSATEWQHIFRGAGYVTGIEVESVSEELDASDHISFHEAGIPAVQLFTGPHPDYHRPSDTLEKIDVEGLIKVAAVAKEAIEYLAHREAPLTATVKARQTFRHTPRLERRVSIGTIPDFSFKGAGCRISGVLPGSPAEACGLKEGDVIIRIGRDQVGSLRELSDILKTLSPGKRIFITFLRGDREITAEVEVRER